MSKVKLLRKKDIMPKSMKSEKRERKLNKKLEGTPYTRKELEACAEVLEEYVYIIHNYTILSGLPVAEYLEAYELVLELICHLREGKVSKIFTEEALESFGANR